jgi:hypothetical protein
MLSGLAALTVRSPIMRRHLTLAFCIFVCMASLLACSTLTKKQSAPVAKSAANQTIIGKWATLLTTDKFSDVLFAEFDAAGRYALTCAWMLPLTPQKPGSQPIAGGTEVGRYKIEGNALYFTPASGEDIHKCTITRAEDLLILDFGGNNRFTFMSMTNFVMLAPI